MQYLQLFKKIDFDAIDPNDEKFWMDHARPTYDSGNNQAAYYRYVLTRPEQGLRTFSLPPRGHYIIDDINEEDIAKDVAVEDPHMIATTRGFTSADIVGFLHPDGKTTPNPFYKKPEAVKEDKPEPRGPML